MLHELRVENLLLLERAELRLSRRSERADRRDRRRQDAAGAGARPAARRPRPQRDRAPRRGRGLRRGRVRAPGRARRASWPSGSPPGADEIVLARRVWPTGAPAPTSAGGRPPSADLRELGSRLLAFYGQHEHRKLMLGAAQLDVLDAHCGADQLELRAGLRSAYARVRELEARAAELRELAGARDRELDLLRVRARGDRGGRSERGGGGRADRRARPAAQRRGAARRRRPARAEAIVPEAGTGRPSCCAAAARAARAAWPSSTRELQALSERLETLRYEAEDLGGELRALRAGARGLAGTARGGRGAARAARPPAAQARRVDRRRCSPTPSAVARAAGELEGAEVGARGGRG